MEIIYYVLLILFISILLWYLTSLFKRRKIKKTIINFPDEWKEILDRFVLFYHNLNAQEKSIFEQKIYSFFNDVKITGVDCNVDDTDRLLVAASAIIPVFRFPNWRYKFLDEVIIYPHAFNNKHQTSKKDSTILGMFGTGYLHGKMVLSRQSLHSGFKIESDKKNVGIHEFVHLIDKQDGSVDGIPHALLENAFAIPWLELIKNKTDEIFEDKSDINPYATTNEAEFFSVVSEYFFEKPKLLKRKHPELYKALEVIFNTKMAEKHKKRMASKEPGRNDPCKCGSGKKYKKCCGR
jgi:Mlc titration factor MtfA (ptsG expression regulator)